MTLRWLAPLLLLLLPLAACGTRPPPENAFRVAGPGEPCYQEPHPWDDPPAGFAQNTSNLPQCPGPGLTLDADGGFLAGRKLTTFRLDRDGGSWLLGRPDAGAD